MPYNSITFTTAKLNFHCAQLLLSILLMPIFDFEEEEDADKDDVIRETFVYETRFFVHIQLTEHFFSTHAGHKRF